MTCASRFWVNPAARRPAANREPLNAITNPTTFADLLPLVRSLARHTRSSSTAGSHADCTRLPKPMGQRMSLSAPKDHLQQRRDFVYEGEIVNYSNDQLLTVDEVGELLGTGARFARRLIAERRIRFVKVGRHVRIPRSALAEFVDAATVLPVSRR